jgi:hypothetical protein
MMLALAATIPGTVLAQQSQGGQAAQSAQVARATQEVQAARAAQAAQASQVARAEAALVAQAAQAKSRAGEIVEKMRKDSAALVRLTGENPTVDLDLDNASVRDALKQIFERAKLDYKIDDDVNPDSRITVRAKNIRFLTALELVLQDAGAGIVREIRDGKGTYHIRKSGAPDSLDALKLFRPSTFADLTQGVDLRKLPDASGTVREYLKVFPKGTSPYLFQFNETRSTFRCPHCKGQSTVLRQAQQPKCEKCARAFMPDWQFCPADGAKRPAAAAEWKYCPFCGKRSGGEKPGDKSGNDPFQEDPDASGFPIGLRY